MSRRSPGAPRESSPRSCPQARALAGPVSVVLAVLVGGCLSAGSRVESAGGTTSGGEDGTLGMSSTTQGSTSEVMTDSTSTSTSTSMSTSTGDESTTECSFLCNPTTGDEGGCSLYVNDCPRGEKCNLYANDGGGWYNATQCVPVDPDAVPPGAPCIAEGNGLSGVDNCELGSVCFLVDYETKEGHCLGFCDGDSNKPTCSEPGTYCYQRTIDGLCLINCDPRWPDCTCVPIPGDGYGCLPDQSGDAGAAGDPCEAHNECDPGLFCLPQASVIKCLHPMCCAPVCDLNEPESCPLAPDHVCLPWYDDPKDIPPGLDNVGVCAIPP